MLHGGADSQSDERGSSGDEDDLPGHPVHDVAHVPDYPARSTCSGLTRNGGGGAMLILDEAADPPITFSAGLPGGIQLSQLSDLRNVHEAMAAPDTDGWKDGYKGMVSHPWWKDAAGCRLYRFGLGKP
jgi:hypothetical protein